MNKFLRGTIGLAVLSAITLPDYDLSTQDQNTIDKVVTEMRRGGADDIHQETAEKVKDLFIPGNDATERISSIEFYQNTVQCLPHLNNEDRNMVFETLLNLGERKPDKGQSNEDFTSKIQEDLECMEFSLKNEEPKAFESGQKDIERESKKTYLGRKGPVFGFAYGGLFLLTGIAWLLDKYYKKGDSAIVPSTILNDAKILLEPKNGVLEEVLDVDIDAENARELEISQ
jgi:hypothetical protein